MAYRSFGAGITLVLAAALSGPAAAHGGNAKPPGGGWERIDGPAPVRGEDGKMHAATCSGFPGSDPKFSFWARKGKSRNLAIYFEGGGACWDNTTCSLPVIGAPPNVPQFFVPQVPPGTDPAQMEGLFKSTDPANPVADWDMVYIPYCTGDIHIGSATKTYTSIGNPAIGLPPGAPITLQHRGFDNFMVVLDWTKRNFRHPAKVLVAGSSAGGYGATANSPWVGRAFPWSPMYVVADASQGVTNTGFDTSDPGRQGWNPQLDRQAFGRNASTLPGNELMRRAARYDPYSRFAQFTTSFDTVQIQFYGAMKQAYGGGTCPNPAVDWHNQMAAKLQSDVRRQDNLKHYVAGGTYHTILSSPALYTEASAGPTVATWLGDMLAVRGPWWGGASAEAQGHRGGSHWRNEACPGCLAQVPCP